MRAAHTQLRFDSLEQEAFLNLWRTFDRLRLLDEQVFGKVDLTPQQYNALRILKAHRPARLPTLVLSSRLISRAPDITRLLDRLVQRGLIVRERLPDNRRVVEVGITDAGMELLDSLETEIHNLGRRQLGHMSVEELEQLIALLARARQPHEPRESSWKTSACGDPRTC